MTRWACYFVLWWVVALLLILVPALWVAGSPEERQAVSPEIECLCTCDGDGAQLEILENGVPLPILETEPAVGTLVHE